MISPISEPDVERGLRFDLLEAGVPLEHLAAVEAIVDREATQQAGEALRRIVLSIPPNIRGAAALRAALLGFDHSLSADAEAAGLSKQAMQTSVKRQVARLRKITE